jgi:hypothetical protein
MAFAFTVVTVIVIIFDVAGEPDTQFALLVITQVIASLFASEHPDHVELVAPATSVPFFCH